MRSRPRRKGYAFLRVDHDCEIDRSVDAENPGPAHVTIKSIVLSVVEAIAEVERLNDLNADKGCTYHWQGVSIHEHEAPSLSDVPSSSDERLADRLVGILADGFNRSISALEQAGAIDRSHLNRHYKGVGSKYYDIVTEQLEYTAMYGARSISTMP